MAGQPAQFQEFAHLAHPAASTQGDRHMGGRHYAVEQIQPRRGLEEGQLLNRCAVGLLTLLPMAEPATGDAQLFGLLALRKARGGA